MNRRRGRRRKGRRRETRGRRRKNRRITTVLPDKQIVIATFTLSVDLKKYKTRKQKEQTDKRSKMN